MAKMKPTHELIDDIIVNNPLNVYFMKGVISASLKNKYTIYKQFVQYLSKHQDKTKAVKLTSTKMKVSCRMVYRSIEHMES